MFLFNQTVLEKLFRTGRTQDSQRLLQIATKAAEETYGTASHEAASVWAAQANLSALSHNPEKVFAAAHRALSIYESLDCKLPHANSLDVAPEVRGLYLTARDLGKVGENDKALTLMGEIIDAQRRQLSEGSLQLQQSFEFKGWLLAQQKNFQAAALAYTQARDSARKSGNGNADAVELANALRQLGRTKEADALLAVKGDRPPAASPLSLEGEAHQCESRGHIEHAQKLFEQAVEATSGECSQERLRTTIELASFFDRQSDYERAKVLYLHVLSALERLDGDPQQLKMEQDCLNNLIDTCVAQRDLSDAARYFDRMRQIEEWLYEDRMLGDRLTRYARSEILIGRREAAEKDLAAAEADFREHPEKDVWQEKMRKESVKRLWKQLGKER